MADEEKERQSEKDNWPEAVSFIAFLGLVAFLVWIFYG